MENFMAVPLPLRDALAEVAKAATSSTGARGLAMTLRPLLEAAVEELEQQVVTRQSRRGTGEIEYVVDKSEQGEVLTERRLSGRSKPFRCPSLIYLTVAEVLRVADRPMSLDEIVSAVERKLQDRPADFQVRVPLRLWMHSAPPLIIRSRARYRATNAFTTAAATKLWRRLRGTDIAEK